MKARTGKREIPLIHHSSGWQIKEAIKVKNSQPSEIHPEQKECQVKKRCPCKKEESFFSNSNVKVSSQVQQKAIQLRERGAKRDQQTWRGEWALRRWLEKTTKTWQWHIHTYCTWSSVGGPLYPATLRTRRLNLSHTDLRSSLEVSTPDHSILTTVANHRYPRRSPSTMKICYVFFLFSP